MDDVERLKKENLHLRCAMFEAAQEILTYWHVHAQDGGLGPYALVDRLLGKDRITDDSNPYSHREREVKSSES
jgi:hypothetical protein